MNYKKKIKMFYNRVHWKNLLLDIVRTGLYTFMLSTTFLFYVGVFKGVVITQTEVHVYLKYTYLAILPFFLIAVFLKWIILKESHIYMADIEEVVFSLPEVQIIQTIDEKGKHYDVFVRKAGIKIILNEIAEECRRNNDIQTDHPYKDMITISDIEMVLDETDQNYYKI